MYNTPQAPTALDWAKLTKQLLFHVSRRLGRRGTRQEAEDIAQDAIVHFLSKSPEPPPPTDTGPVPFIRQMCSIANGLIINHMRTSARERTKVEAFAHYLDTATASSSPEQTVIHAEAAATADALFAKRLVHDPLCYDVLQLQLRGTWQAIDQSIVLRRPISEIYNAKRRLKFHINEARTLLANQRTHAPYQETLDIN